MDNLSFLTEILNEGKSISEAVKQKFGNLSPKVLNTKPSPDSWSIGEWFDHLIVLNTSYFELLTQIESGTYKASFWARLNPFSKMIGKMLLRALNPENKAIYDTQPVWEPAQSTIPEDIVSRFLTNHEVLMQKLGKLTTVNLEKTLISAPVVGIISYPLSSLCKILIVHEKRHILQAENVLKMISDANK